VVDGPSIPGTVSDVEYQGTYVRVAIAAEGGADLAAELSESQFDAAGYSIGEPVLVTWESAHASRLKPVNFATTNSATVNSATVAPAETAA
jgi:putative spermidine/putrescine transport system ATP-binding protein